MRCSSLLILLSLWSVSVQAQSGGTFLSSSPDNVTISNYYFAKPNELTITVNVMGHVHRPGRYEISRAIDLVNLLALAGGATDVGDMGDVRLTRFSEIGSKITRNEFRLDLEDIAAVDPAQLTLQSGDIIQVGRSSWSTFRDAFSVVVSAAIITTAVSQIIIATKR